MRLIVSLLTFSFILIVTGCANFSRAVRVDAFDPSGHSSTAAQTKLAPPDQPVTTSPTAGQIRIAKRDVIRYVPDPVEVAVLAEVEKTYWQLAQARTDVVIQRILVAQTYETVKTQEARRAHGVSGTIIPRAKALLGTRQAGYETCKERVKTLECQVKALISTLNALVRAMADVVEPEQLSPDQQ